MAGYAASHPSPSVHSAPFFKSGTITSGGTITIALESITDSVNVTATSGTGTLLFAATTAGLSGDAYMGLALGNSTGALDVRMKQIVLSANSTDMGYQLVAVLGREQASDYPDITAANGFEGVE